MLSIDQILSNPVFITIAIVAVIAVTWLITRARKMPYVACDALLTKSELKFYKILKMAMPNDMMICMKVRMGDIITCSDSEWKAGWGPRVSAKHIDFVLIDKDTTEVKVCIELDDSTHKTNPDRIARDKFVNKAFEVANVPLLRIPVQKYYDLEGLKREILS
jgi:hypothetical protein